MFVKTFLVLMAAALFPTTVAFSCGFRRALLGPSPSASHVCRQSQEGEDEKWISDFNMPDPVPTFQWTPERDVAKLSYTARRLLLEDCFIDKSAATFQLLKEFYDPSVKDFDSVPVWLVFPRRFAKTTLLGFIEAVYTPLPTLDGSSSKDVKTKIAALEKGPELLAFGMHPVLRLNMMQVKDVGDLIFHIKSRLEVAGLEEEDFTFPDDSSPARLLEQGVKLLNKKFKKETGKNTRTIVLIDEYDKPFRNKDADDDLLTDLTNLYGVSKNEYSGTSLVVLCGLTRMVGTGLSQLNNLYPVSPRSKYHGICGISAAELVHCAGSQLDDYARKKEGKNFTEIVEGTFRDTSNGFRFGLDNDKGLLDLDAPSSALFSPMDVWGLVISLMAENGQPMFDSSVWIKSMGAEFEFASLNEKYTKSSDGFVELAENLAGARITREDLERSMKRENYLMLSENEDVQKVLFELGLLTVKQVGEQEILLGSPNWLVTENALTLLVDKAGWQVFPQQDLAEHYLSSEGLSGILSQVEREITNTYGMAGLNIVREYPFQDVLFLEYLARFPPRSKDYATFKEVFTDRTKEVKEESGKADMAVELRFGEGKGRVYMMELKLAKIDSCDSQQIEKQHKQNIKAAEKQIRSYEWKETNGSVVERIVISGVWCPHDEELATFQTFQLKTIYKYLGTLQPPVSSVLPGG